MKKQSIQTQHEIAAIKESLLNLGNAVQLLNHQVALKDEFLKLQERVEKLENKVSELLPDLN